MITPLNHRKPLLSCGVHDALSEWELLVSGPQLVAVVHIVDWSKEQIWMVTFRDSQGTDAIWLCDIGTTTDGDEVLLTIKNRTSLCRRKQPATRPAKKLRIMCVCAGGNVRSHALAYLMKSRGHSAFAVGVDHFDAQSLCDLATVVDFVLTTEQGIHDTVLQRLPEEQHDRVHLIPIGGDRWGPSIPQELLNQCKTLMADPQLPPSLCHPL